MVMEKRRQTILSILIEDGHVRVSDLAERFRVSDDTIRRDLSALSDEGYLQKTHGGAVNLDVPSMRRDMRRGIAQEAKEQIGEQAVAHLTIGDTIFLDAGQTVLEVAKRLPAGSFTVITPSLDVANALSVRTDIRLIILGGEWDHAQRLFRGQATIEAIKNFRANTMVTGACAIDRTFGVTASEEWDAAAKRAMLAVSERKMLVADHTKMGRREPFFVSPLEDYDFFITDRPAAENLSVQQNAEDAVTHFSIPGIRSA
ncbi:DeoR/GlpR family DNA-binding transcription regulator [Rhizobium sp. CF142]|uniref:DeoR/GlpR family DNA-binding transcription regulator n=1 Tax=Rhizobium sp. CF142 TaxID=1144314 RepID=UPI00026EF4E3|nr:DeoR/GlpR family DNA-binding transcription regulator [Rhizobium sp. CF142]EJJ27089.1 transcriptional regulator of sugar metabolism [Rhizobium sp. CF142]